MGPLRLPLTGQVYLDASGFIHSVELIEPCCTSLGPLWRQAQSGTARGSYAGTFGIGGLGWQA